MKPIRTIGRRSFLGAVAVSYLSNWPVGFFVGTLSAVSFGVGRVTHARSAVSAVKHEARQLNPALNPFQMHAIDQYRDARARHRDIPLRDITVVGDGARNDASPGGGIAGDPGMGILAVECALDNPVGTRCRI